MSEINATEPVAFAPTGNEVETLLSTLDRNRSTFAWKCSGLDAAGTNARLGPSTITLGGLLKHLALIEEYARHTGHADLIRESVDGLVGEDPPQPR